MSHEQDEQSSMHNRQLRALRCLRSSTTPKSNQSQNIEPSDLEEKVFTSPIASLLAALKAEDREAFVNIASHFEDLYRESAHSRSMKSESFESLEIITCLLDALRSWPRQSLGMVVVVLWLLARNDNNKVHIVNSGGVILGLEIMQKHFKQGELQQELLAMLRNVAHSNEGSQALIADGGVPQVLAVMKAHRMNESIQTEALAMMGNVAYNCEEGHSLMLREGVVALAMQVLKQHLESEMLARAALIMLWKVTHHNVEGGACVVQEGGMLPIINSMRYHSASGAVQIRALRALDELIKQNKEYVMLLILEGGIHPLFQPTAFVASSSLRAELVKHVQYHCRPVLRTLLAVRACPVTELHTRLGLLYLSDPADLMAVFTNERDVACLTNMLTDKDIQVRTEGARSLQYLLQAADCSPTFVPSPKRQVVNSPQNFSAFLNDESLCDVIFEVEGRPYHAHRIVLKASTSSSVFSTMMSCPMREATAATSTESPSMIPIDDIGYDTFAGLMEYLYTGDVTVTPETATDMMMVAERFLVAPLQLRCVEVMAANLDADTIWTAYEIVKQCNILPQDGSPDEVAPAEALLDACACCLIQQLEAFCRDETFVEKREELAKLIQRKVWKALPLLSQDD